MSSQPTGPVPPPGCPAHNSGSRIPLYSQEFAADPQAYYEYMRYHSPTSPVELAPGVEATLVTDYTAALQLLQDPGSFRKDARRWRDLNDGKISPDSPVLPLLAHRPNCMFTDGAEHLRLRRAVTDSFARVDPHWLSRIVQQVSDYLIAQLSHRGSADLLNDYAKQLPLLVFNILFGCTADIGDTVTFCLSNMFDGINAEKANEVLFQVVSELVSIKRSRPGDDVTSWMMQHPARLNDEEMTHQLVLLLGAGAEPLRNLIGNTLHRLLTEDRYSQGGLIDEAIDDTLLENPPMSNYAPHYPAADMEFAGQKMRAGDLVLVSFAAANTGPELKGSGQTGSQAHLSWSVGRHACPSKETARLIAAKAIENVFNALPDVDLAVPADSLTWRPGPFNRALAALPVRFTAEKPAQQPAQQSAPRAQTPVRDGQGDTAPKAERSRWSSFLSWLKG